ncbi:MAG TPA: aminotransferase class I/II-fold pyridoxal phosphate-dependent enzyme [Burkholderiaceae bacterium]|nr:aminotransferase class I/II-fold pyridoxal phosphate-dependent enzyme [Burkholderiaceae bacterium]
MTTTPTHFSADTLCAHGAPLDAADSAIVPPIVYSATFAARDADEFAAMASQPRHARYYTRYGNPLHEQVAAKLVALEGASSDTHGALVTASGMGAISLVLLGLLKAGDHVVAQTNHYMASAKHFSELLPRFGVRCTLVDQTDLAQWERAIRPGTRLVMTETPVNPTCALTDLAAVARLARTVGALSVCDNTFASPLNQQPLAHGIDLVVHSATKYLGGHHDITAGAVVASHASIDALWPTQICLGATLSPMDAWLLLRGLRTLALRVRQHNASALALARWLEAQPQVERVFYPGLASHPQHALALSQMKGFGGVMNVVIRGGYDEASRFVHALKLPRQAVSLGGVESLVVHSAAMWHGTMNDDQLRVAGIAPNAVRLSVGVEGVDDLQADLAQALAAV